MRHTASVRCTCPPAAPSWPPRSTGLWERNYLYSVSTGRLCPLLVVLYYRSLLFSMSYMGQHEFGASVEWVCERNANFLRLQYSILTFIHQTYCLFRFTMAPPIRPTKLPNKHTTPRTRNRVWASLCAGKKAAVIASEEGIKTSLVYGIKRRFTAQDWGVTKAGRGRRSALSADDQKALKDAAEEDPGISVGDLQKKVTPHVTIWTVRRYLLKCGIPR